MQTRYDERFMEFRIGDQWFAVPLLNVKEVLQKPEICSIPNMPAHFEGMMNLRGQILGVYNTRKRLSAKAKDATIQTSDVVIVIECDGVMAGMIVDEVTKVLHADEKMIQPAPLKDDDQARRYVSFVIQSEKALVLALNISQLLGLGKIKQLETGA